MERTKGKMMDILGGSTNMVENTIAAVEGGP
jgi:hypothetical protein